MERLGPQVTSEAISFSTHRGQQARLRQQAAPSKEGTPSHHLECEGRSKEIRSRVCGERHTASYWRWLRGAERAHSHCRPLSQSPNSLHAQDPKVISADKSALSTGNGCTHSCLKSFGE